MSRKVKELIRAAGLRDELTFTSFRHGRFTEAGDAELTDRELVAQGRYAQGARRMRQADYAPSRLGYPQASRSANRRQPVVGMSTSNLCRNEIAGMRKVTGDRF
jgi:hypothetical protein